MKSSESEHGDRTFTMIGVGSGVGAFAIFTALGVYALETVTYGVIMGLFAGGGSVLSIPWWLRLSVVQNESDENVPFSEAVRRAGGDLTLSMFGVGLYLGAFAMFAVALIFTGPDPVVGLAVAVPIAVVAPYVGSTLVEIT